MSDKISVQVNTTIIQGKSTNMKIFVDGKEEYFEVPVEVMAYFDTQFVRSNPSALQKKKYKTLMKLLEQAFLAGKKSNNSRG